MKIRKVIAHFVKYILRYFSDYQMYRMCCNQFRNYIKINGFENKKAEGEDEYKHVWHQLSHRVEPYSYRLFRNYCGNNPYIIPEDIGHSIIERVLNPIPYRPVYTDKNMFPLIVGRENVPKTIICRINGGPLRDGDYNVISNVDAEQLIYSHDSFIIKPTVGGSSGRGVEKFVKTEKGKFTPPISKEYMMKYGNDFCLQETIKQSAFMSKFCKTSVNTMRLVTYRSVKDDRVMLSAGILRIGKEGYFVDNTHSGGRYVKIDVKTGLIGNILYNLERQKSSEKWNGVDFKRNTFIIPNWDEIVEFSIRIGTKILHHRLLALDIALDENNHPILVEYNIGGFSYGLFLSTGQDIFAGETLDVIEYCKGQDK